MNQNRFWQLKQCASCRRNLGYEPLLNRNSRYQVREQFGDTTKTTSGKPLQTITSGYLGPKKWGQTAPLLRTVWNCALWIVTTSMGWLLLTRLFVLFSLPPAPNTHRFSGYDVDPLPKTEIGIWKTDNRSPKIEALRCPVTMGTKGHPFCWLVDFKGSPKPQRQWNKPTESIGCNGCFSGYDVNSLQKTEVSTLKTQFSKTYQLKKGRVFGVGGTVENSQTWRQFPKKYIYGGCPTYPTKRGWYLFPENQVFRKHTN